MTSKFTLGGAVLAPFPSLGPLLLASALALLTTPGAAQGNQGTGGDATGVQGGPPVPPGFEEIKEVEAADGDREVDPSSVIEARDTMSAMVPMPMVKPARIAPGGNGTLIIVLSLLDTTVIEAGASIEVGYEAKQSPVTLAQWAIDPPKPGKHPGVFQGKPVYDDTGMIRIPIAIEGTAKFGKYPVDLALQIPLHESKKGKPIGVFSQRLRAEVVVGRPMPTPAVVIPGRAPKAAPEAAPAGGSAPAAVADEIGVELRALRGLVIPAGGSRSFDLTAVLPAEAYLMIDPDLKLPKVSVTGLPDGVVVRPGPAPAGEPKTIAGEPMEIVRDRYRRSITLQVAASVPVGTYQGSATLDYIPCTESQCHDPAKLQLPFELRVTEASAVPTADVEPESEGDGELPADGGQPPYLLFGGIGLGVVLLMVLFARRGS